jgi:hypothetical protein
VISPVGPKTQLTYIIGSSDDAEALPTCTNPKLTFSSTTPARRTAIGLSESLDVVMLRTRVDVIGIHLAISPARAQPFGSTGEKCSALKSTRSVGQHNTAPHRPHTAERVGMQRKRGGGGQSRELLRSNYGRNSPHGERWRAALAEPSSLAVAGFVSCALSTTTVLGATGIASFACSSDSVSS